MVEIYHIYHSGVALIINNKLFVIDYCGNNPDRGKEDLIAGVIHADDMADIDEWYVFVTHSHGDHYNPVIFNWQQIKSEIQYFLSDDIIPPKAVNNLKMVSPYQFYKENGLEIETYGSTDQGVSYLIKSDGISIFHAGDLNWWHWKDFSKDELKREERDFKKEIERVKEKEINIAFIPVDPRLKEYYYLAGEYFAQKVKPDLIIPIHFRKRHNITKMFKNKIKTLGIDVEAAVINQRGEKIIYQKGEK